MEENSKDESKEIIPGYKSVQQFTQEGFKVLMGAIRNSNALPQDRNFDFYKTHSSFRKLMDDEGSSILQMINTIIKDQGISGNFANRDLEEKLEVIVEANDAILERAATNLDEVNGIRKNPDLNLKMQEVSATLPVSGSWNKMENMNMKVSSFQPETGTLPNPANAIRLITANNIQRPQKFFKDRIDNSNKYPWDPRIKEKPNSIKPLAIFLEENENGTQSYSHPYEFELDKFEPSDDLLKKIEPKMPKSLEETPLKMVETQDQLDEMLQDLLKYKEIAVDLEHHSYRTFLGITCLMQISTGDSDYIIDTLCLRDKLYVLNEVFTKPSIVKVFHGADHDVEWLQRDLSLYVVNMFDTYQAAKQLNFEHRSLAFLLRKYCSIDVNKHFQLADWRIRPLPEELKLYAREDTHYLLYIYHILRNELLHIGNNNPHILKSVIDQSTATCKKRFEKPILTENSHMLLYRKFKKLFDNKQMYALKELYQWRDNIARQEDESIGYVLPNHMLLQICEVLPREMQGILACCNPIPPLVRANLLEIHKIILKAREQPLVKPILSEEPRSLGSVQTVTRLNVDNALNCPHDISNAEFREDLPTLLGDILKQKKKTTDSKIETNNPLTTLVNQKVLLESSQPHIDIFEKIEHSLRSLEQEAKKKVKKVKFLGPFARYKLVKPYMQSEEEKKVEFLAKEKMVENNKIVTVPDLPKTIETSSSTVTKAENKTTTSSEAQEGDTVRKVTEVGRSFQIEISSKSSGTSPNKKVKQPDIPLRQMAGCKRKRSPSPQERQEENGRNPEEEPSIEERVAPLLDVTPQERGWKSGKNKRPRNKQGGPPPKKRSNDNTNTNQSFENNSNKQELEPNQNNQQNNKKRKNKKFKNKMKQNKHQQNPSENNQGSQNPQNSNIQNNNWSNKQNNQQKQKFKNQQPNNRKSNEHQPGNRQHNDSNQSNTSGQNDYQPFDYSSVDFRQFQGGARGVNRGGNFKTNFRGKNKSKIRGRGVGKGNNRSSFFGMNTGSGNRGRGR